MGVGRGMGAALAVALVTMLGAPACIDEGAGVKPRPIEAGTSADASACGSCTCSDALAGRCAPTCASVNDARERVFACARANRTGADCASCATGDLEGCSRCYDRCATESDACLGGAACAPQYPTCAAALQASVSVASTALCGRERLVFLALGQCACRAGCAATCPGFCSGSATDDVAACGKCFQDQYRGVCATPFAACGGGADASTSDAAQDSGDASPD